MHRAPARASRNAKKDRTCGKQVLSVVTTWFKPAEIPVHQTPIRAVPLHDISPLFAPQSQSHGIPRPQQPQAIPIKSLHDISPLFPRLDDRVAPITPQAEYLFPRAATDLLMPQPLRPVKLKKQPLRPIAYPHDSFLFRAKRVNLEPVLGGEAEEYYRETAEHQGIPTVRPTSQRRPLSDCSEVTERDSTNLTAIPMARQATERRPLSDCSSSSDSDIAVDSDCEGSDTDVDTQSTTPIPMARPAAQRRPFSDCSSGSEATVYFELEGNDTYVNTQSTTPIAMARQSAQRRPISDCSSSSEKSSIASIPMVKPAAQRRPLSDVSSASEATVGSNWQVNLFSPENDFRTKHLAVLDKEAQHNTVLVQATTRHSVAAKLCWASDSEDSDSSTALSSSPRRNSFSVYVHSSPSTQEDNAVDRRTVQEPTYVDIHDTPCVEDPGWLDVYQEWSALMMCGKDQACLARFAHLWEDTNAEPVDQSLFAAFDGDFTQGGSTDEPKGSRPPNDRFESLPTADRLREAFLKRNVEHPDTEAYPDKWPDVLFRNLYKLRSGRSF
jgi:hypothetical protein